MTSYAPIGDCAVYECTEPATEPVVALGTVVAFVCAEHHPIITDKDSGSWVLRTGINVVPIIYPPGVDAPWPGREL